jgi:hypothetical protein
VTILPPEDDRRPGQWATRKPYTYARALDECRWNLAGAMLAAAGMGVMLAALGVGVISNAVIVALFGSVGCTYVVIVRVHRRRRGPW